MVSVGAFLTVAVNLPAAQHRGHDDGIRHPVRLHDGGAHYEQRRRDVDALHILRPEYAFARHVGPCVLQL